jgi:hypothetical protein
LGPGKRNINSAQEKAADNLQKKPAKNIIPERKP